MEWGYEFTIVPPNDDAEQGSVHGETPSELVMRFATQKAQDVAERTETGLTETVVVVGCDTVAVCEGRVLGKPKDRSHARQMLQLMRGKRHSVLSGVCLQNPGHLPKVAVDETVLVMDDVTDEQIEEYLDTDLWIGKAGAFGFQDGLNWISIERGSESNVVGLPMELLARMISESDDDIDFGNIGARS